VTIKLSLKTLAWWEKANAFVLFVHIYIGDISILRAVYVSSFNIYQFRLRIAFSQKKSYFGKCKGPFSTKRKITPV